MTVSCAQGDVGHVHADRIPMKRVRTDLSAAVRPHTDIMINIGNPDVVFQARPLPTTAWDWRSCNSLSPSVSRLIPWR